MSRIEFDRLSDKVGIEAAMVIAAFRQVDGALTRKADLKKPEPFPSLLQSAEDERRVARNEGKL